MTDEIWRTIQDFPAYEVSNLGRVQSNKRGEPKILKPWLHNSGGYPAVKLSVRGAAQQTKLIHQLVCRAFHGRKPTPRHEVAHNDGVPTNVRADNLRWALPWENAADKRSHGTHINAGQFKPQLTPDDVREIRRLLTTGMSQRLIAEQFGIWQTMVSHIHLRRRWADLD
jgi:hypothetical protein